MKGLVLSLFPGIGMLDMAFEEEGYCVVRGPDILWGGDIKTFHVPAGRFDGVIGGPPCQVFSAMKRLNPLAGEKHGNLIPEYQRVVAEAQPAWFVMENVEAAPYPKVKGYKVHSQLLRDHWVGGETSRLRRFSFGTADGRKLQIDTLALHSADPRPAVLAGASGRMVPVAIGGSGKRKSTASNGGADDKGSRVTFEQQLRDQGLPEDFLADAPFSLTGKRKMIGNGVPLAMGRAVAKAVARAMSDRAAA